jgi:hypothetical protein
MGSAVLVVALRFSECLVQLWFSTSVLGYPAFLLTAWWFLIVHQVLALAFAGS